MRERETEREKQRERKRDEVRELRIFMMIWRRRNLFFFLSTPLSLSVSFYIIDTHSSPLFAFPVCGTERNGEEKRAKKTGKILIGMILCIRKTVGERIEREKREIE